MQNLTRDAEKIYIIRNKNAIFPVAVLGHDFVRQQLEPIPLDLLLKWLVKGVFNACCNKGWFFFSGFARLWPVVIWTPASQLLERWNVSCLHYP